MSSSNALDTSLEDAPFSHVSDDWYHGHKVVAMPSSAFGGMSIREVVSSRNESEQQATNSSNRPVRRSNSLGRQPIRPGRDIVQDVYDRMGVSYTRGLNYEMPIPPSSTTGGFEDQPGVPMGQIQTTPSFSDQVSDFSVASSVTNNMIPPPGAGGQPPPASRPSASGKIKDKFSGRYRAAAAMTRGTPDRGRAGRPTDPALQNRGRATEPRGRTVDPRLEEPESEGRRRARSLSRGLSVQGRWPPVRTQVEVQQSMDNTPVSNSKSAAATNKNAGYTSPPATAESCRNNIFYQQQPQLPASPTRPKSPLKRSHSFDARPQYGLGFRSPPSTAMLNKMKTPQTAPPPIVMTNDGSIRDEKKDDEERSSAASEAGSVTVEDNVSTTPPIPSIKDRISAFAGKSNSVPSTQRSAGRRNTISGGNYMPAPPPKVDIYNGGRGNNENMVVASYPHPSDDAAYEETVEMATPSAEDFVPQPPKPSAVPPSVAADAAAIYMRPSQVAKKKAASRHSTGSARSSIANSYLSGIQSSTSTTTVSTRSSFQQQPQMLDGSANSNTEDVGYNGSSSGQPGISDGNSVGAISSNSYGDAGIENRAPRRASWQKPNTQNGIKNNVGNPVANANSGGDNISMEAIEKMVDERVQVQLREVEARMEGLLRRWMDSMNNKITSRLDAMEKSIKDSLPRHEI